MKGTFAISKGTLLNQNMSKMFDLIVNTNNNDSTCIFWVVGLARELSHLISNYTSRRSFSFQVSRSEDI